MPITASHTAGRLVGGRHHLPRPRGDLAAGNTQWISFGQLWEGDGDLYVDAVLHVPCRWLQQQGGQAKCALYGFNRHAAGATPLGPAAAAGGEPFSGGGSAAERRTPAPHGPAAEYPHASGAAGTQPLCRGALPTADPGRGRRAAGTCRSRSCVPTTSHGWRRWCACAARRISVKSSGRGTFRSRWRSSPPAAIWTRTASGAASTGGSGRMVARPSRTSAPNGPRRTGDCTRVALRARAEAAAPGPGGAK